jgi:hypothetical protein
MSSSPGSDRVQKGAVNVAETGPAACKSRTASTARDDAWASETSYRRCHGEARMDDRPRRLKSVLEASVWIGNSSRSMSMLPEPGQLLLGDWVYPSWVCRASCSEARHDLRSQGYSRPPTAPRVPSFEHGNSDTSAGQAKPGKPPGPARSRAGDGASVVVRARESRVHGEGRQ